MIERLLQPRLLDLATRYPVITLTGPRQSGKTTLSRMAFPDRPYVSLENPSSRELAQEDPLAFLARYQDGAVIDEVQRVPQIFSYLQGMVDEDPRPGRFLLTGSQNLALVDAVTQSLAGRTTLAELLPLSLAEVRRFPDPPAELDTLPAAALLRQLRQAAHQGAEALLLRRRPGDQPAERRDPAPARKPPVAGSPLRDLGRR